MQGFFQRLSRTPARGGLSSLAAWSADLERALAMGPAHVSTYGLTYEKGTRLWKQRRAGLLRALDEDAELEMYKAAIDIS